MRRRSPLVAAAVAAGALCCGSERRDASLPAFTEPATLTDINPAISW